MLFVCEKCGCIDDIKCDNNFYAVTYGFKSFDDEFYNKHLCCTECTPSKYADGIWSLSGQWHDRFPKVHWTQINKKKFIEMSKSGQIYNGLNIINSQNQK